MPYFVGGFFYVRRYKDCFVPGAKCVLDSVMYNGCGGLSPLMLPESVLEGWEQVLCFQVFSQSGIYGLLE